MTFEQFQSGKRWSADLAAAVSSAPWDTDAAPRGWLYLDALYIEEVREHWPEAARAAGRWHLLLNRCEWISDDLPSLEKRLYDWAASEGYLQ